MKKILSLLFCLAAWPAFGQQLDGLPIQGTGHTPAMNSTSIVPLCVGSTTTGVPGRCKPARTSIGGLFTTPVSPLTLYGWTTATRPTTPAAGMMGWNTTIGAIEVWNGTAWSTTSAFLGGAVPNATIFSAPGTALTVNNNASIGGNLIVSGTVSSSGGGTFSGSWGGTLTLNGAGTALAVVNNATFGSVTMGGQLDLKSWTTAGRPAAPAAGAMGWNTDLSQIDIWTGASWASAGTYSGGPVAGEAFFNAAPESIQVANVAHFHGQIDLGQWTTVGRPAAPAAGTIGFNTDTSTIDLWDGAAWVAPSAFLGGAVPNATTFQAAGTGLTVNNDALVSGKLTSAGRLDLANWTTAGRPVAPVAGTTGWNTDLTQLDVWNGAAWINPSGFTGGSVAGATTFTAAGTALTVDHNALVTGTLTVGALINSSVSTNTLWGSSAGAGLTTGNNNTFIGYHAAIAETTGQWNVAVGSQALSTGFGNSYNTAIGYGALGNVDQSANTGVGYIACASVTSGIGNTCLGYRVGSSVLTTGSNNVLIGTGTAVTTPAAGTANYLNIQNVITTTGTNVPGTSITTIAGSAVLTGGATTNTLTSIGATLSLGTTAATAVNIGNGAATTTVAGKLTSSGQINLANWTTAGRPGAPVAGTTGWNTDLTALDVWNGAAWTNPSGFTGGVVPNGTIFTAVGNAVTVNNDALITGTLTVGKVAQVAGTNTLWGTSAGANITSGTNDTFIGYQTGDAVTSGVNNVALGSQALGAAVTGGSNTAAGVGALQNATGSNNQGLGYSACSAVTTGTANVCVGYTVGNATLTTGANNVLIGTGAVDTPTAATSNYLNIQNVIKTTGTNVPASSVTTIAGSAVLTGGATANSFTSIGTTLSLGTTVATAINIGSGGSTTTITGTFSCPSCALPLTNLATQAPNTVVANATAGAAAPTAVAVPSCTDTGGNHLNYTSGAGFSCGTTGGGSGSPGAIFGLTTARASNTTLTVAAGKATDEIGGSVTIAAGSPLTLDFGTTGANGLDAGVFTAGHTYHVFVISKLDGTSASLASLSLTPALPATYVYRRRIGSVLSLTGPVLFNWVQYGDEFLLSAPYTEFDADPINTSAHTVTLARCPTGIAVEAILVGEYQYSTYFSPLSLTDADPYGAENVASDTGGFQISNVNIWTNTSAQLRYRVSVRTVGLSLRILGRGWIDRRGRDG